MSGYLVAQRWYHAQMADAQRQRDAVTDNREALDVCDRCGEPAETLTEVEDRDRETGYLDILDVCDSCLEKRGKR